MKINSGNENWKKEKTVTVLPVLNHGHHHPVFGENIVAQQLTKQQKQLHEKILQYEKVHKFKYFKKTTKYLSL